MLYRVKRINADGTCASAKVTFLVPLICALFVSTAKAQHSESDLNTENTESKPPNTWSEPVNGLQARLVLIQKEKLHRVHWLVPYLELRNARDLNNAMEVDCSTKQLKIELVDKHRKPIRSGWMMPRSGPVPDLSVVVLPMDSFMRISLECRNWGIGKDSAMIQTDSGAWALSDEENGKVFLTATLVGEKGKPHWKRWHGKLELPLVRVQWDETTDDSPKSKTKE